MAPEQQPSPTQPRSRSWPCSLESCMCYEQGSLWETLQLTGRKKKEISIRVREIAP